VKPTKTEKEITRAIYQDQSWMQRNHGMIVGPSTVLCTGTLSLNYGRNKVMVYGAVAIRIAERMIQQGRLNGEICQPESWLEKRVTILLEGQPLAAANNVDKSQDIRLWPMSPTNAVFPHRGLIPYETGISTTAKASNS